MQPDDPLCEVETDKAVFPIESDVEGVVQTWLVEEGDEVTVGQSLLNWSKLFNPSRIRRSHAVIQTWQSRHLRRRGCFIFGGDETDGGHHPGQLLHGLPMMGGSS